jgi:hypothetical protein
MQPVSIESGPNWTPGSTFYAFLAIYLLVDMFLLLKNVLYSTGRGGCREDNWWSLYITPANGFLEPDPCPDVVQGNKTPGRWSSYAETDGDGVPSTCLYEAQVDNIVNDIRNNYRVQGYTFIQLLAYIIIPVFTIECILVFLITTRDHITMGEITFWLIILTLVYTGLTTVVQDVSDIELVPSESSCLNHLTNSFNFSMGDELTYSFVARKQDGTKCFIQGTYLGTDEGGIEAPDQPPVFNGDISSCSSDALQLY